MKKFFKFDYSCDNESLIVSVDSISHVYFDAENEEYVIALKTMENGNPVEFYLPKDFSIDEFYLEIEDRFPL